MTWQHLSTTSIMLLSCSVSPESLTRKADISYPGSPLTSHLAPRIRAERSVGITCRNIQRRVLVMTVTPVSPVSAPGESPVATATPRIGHSITVGAAGFAWCSLALGLSTVGAMNAAGSSGILTGTFFYGGIVQLIAGFFALAAGTTFVAAFMTTYGAFWLSYTAIQVYLAPHIVSSVMSSGAATGASQQA